MPLYLTYRRGRGVGKADSSVPHWMSKTPWFLIFANRYWRVGKFDEMCREHARKIACPLSVGAVDLQLRPNWPLGEVDRDKHNKEPTNIFDLTQ